MRRVLAWLLPLMILSRPVRVLAGDCPTDWTPGFSRPGGKTVQLATYWPADPPLLVVGGSFTEMGGLPAGGLAGWDGVSWWTFGKGLPAGNPPQDLAAFDDGHGSKLYVVGDFTKIDGVPAHGIACWNGREWKEVGGGFDTYARALAVFDDGTGPALIAGGGFGRAGDVRAQGLAKWDGAQWSAIGDAYLVQCLETVKLDEDAGPRLIAAGTFNKVGSVSARNIAAWDGQQWTKLGNGLDHAARYLGVFEGDLIAASDEQLLGETRDPVRWNGKSWARMGSGAGFSGTIGGLASAVFDGHERLFVTGSFRRYGDRDVRYLAEWQHDTWNEVNPGIDYDGTGLYTHQIDDTAWLLIMGKFDLSGGVKSAGLADWDGTRWRAFGNGADSNVAAVLVLPDCVIVGGEFRYMAGQEVNGVARWDGHAWSPMGAELRRVRKLLAVGAGEERALYASGKIQTDKGVVDAVTRWSGEKWEMVGDAFDNWVSGLAIYDDGNGPRLYAVGDFTRNGTRSVVRVGVWDGTKWATVGGGASQAPYCATVFDGPDGSELYVGGYLERIGGKTMNGVARWNGQRWSQLADGLKGGALTLLVHDDGTGAALYAGGSFFEASGVPVKNIARWDGRDWTTLGAGLNNVVLGLARDPFGGRGIIAGGTFRQSGDVYIDYLARWDGASWQALGGGTDNNVADVQSDVDPGGTALWIGGYFLTAGGRPAGYVARRALVEPILRAGDSNGDGAVDFDDIDCFVAALSGATEWSNCGGAAPPDWYLCVNDLSGDGAVGPDDIDGFVECLVNGGCP